MDLSDTTLETVARFSFAITAAVTIAGWYVVAQQTERREYRKEIRDRVKDLAEIVTKVHNSAVAYWLTGDTPDSVAAAIALKSELKELSRHAQSLRHAGLEFDQPTLISEIRKAATGGDFDKKGRRRGAGDADRVADTISGLEDLMRALDTAFYEKFRPLRPHDWVKILLLVAIILVAL